MSGFKLLAIRPLKDCAPQYRKVLQEGEVYQFYNDYEFKFDDDTKPKSERKVIDVIPQETLPDNFYKLENNDLKINISAIVGKNGSGKSSLFELLYLSLYLISVEKKIIEPNLEWLSIQLSKSRLTKKKEKELLEKKEIIEKIYNQLKVEIYYSNNDEITCLRINGKAGISKSHKKDSKTNKIKVIHLIEAGSFDFNDFFYTIAVNYSIYSLLPDYSGYWLKDVFHKNDGYQTPLVINPFRNEEGVIKVKGETHLAQTRLICNLINDKFQIKEVLKGKNVSEVIFEVEEPETPLLFNYYNLAETVERLTKRLGEKRDAVFNKIYCSVLKIRNNQIDFNPEEIVYYERIVNYTIGKVIKIAHHYKEFDKFKDIDDKRPNGQNASPFPSIKNFDKYLEELQKNNTHITLKLRQILNTVKFNLLKSDETLKWNGNKFKISIEVLKQRIEEAIKKQKGKKVKVIELIPAAFYKPKILINNDNNKSSVNGFEYLSSGELQQIHTTQSIYYHILNVDSIKRKENTLKYNFINLCLDEVELYFHPEFQRRFIFELLNGLSNLTIEISAINIIFSTHSPFILSDIPKSNILRIDNGAVKAFKAEEETLGGNIHQQLKDNFFLENTIGEDILLKVNEIVQFYTKVTEVKADDYEQLLAEYKNKQSKFKYIVNNFGENYIQGVLKNHIQIIEEKLGVADSIEKRIQSLESELEKLKALQK